MPCTPAVAKNGFVFRNCTGSQRRDLIPTLGIFWKFHVNIAHAQVNPLCSCQSSIAVLIVGRRKLTLPQRGMAFSVFSIFSYFRFFALIMGLRSASSTIISPSSNFILGITTEEQSCKRCSHNNLFSSMPLKLETLVPYQYIVRLIGILIESRQASDEDRVLTHSNDHKSFEGVP